mmetsp:Transcript_20147/g.46951  ORF Transcript_20147/g.46951 Transcript_20147/m.46951 type:complete len:234 (-) Transcript_20147:90-791(-)
MGIPESDVLDPRSLSDVHMCTICHEVLSEPLECPDCQTAWCSACITRCLEVDSRCPQCRRQFQSVRDLPQAHRSIRTELAKLIVKCPQEGCAWHGRLDSRPGHECMPMQLVSLNAQIVTLQTQLHQKDKEIEDLKRLQISREARITELETKLQEQSQNSGQRETAKQEVVRALNMLASAKNCLEGVQTQLSPRSAANSDPDKDVARLFSDIVVDPWWQAPVERTTSCRHWLGP